MAHVALFVCGLLLLAAGFVGARQDGRGSRARYSPGWVATSVVGWGVLFLLSIDMFFICLRESARGHAALWLLLHQTSLVAASVWILSCLLVRAGVALERHIYPRFSRIGDVAAALLCALACVSPVVLIGAMVLTLGLYVIERL